MDAAFPDNYRFLARYNRWINQCLYQACESLSDAERKQERGAFFGSIHHTLTHLVLADKMWLHRFASQQTVFAALSPAMLALPDGSDYSSDLHPDWHDLRQTRDALDEVIEQWLAGMVPDFLTSTMRRGAQETGEGVEAEPDWDMTSQSPPDYPDDQRTTW